MVAKNFDMGPDIWTAYEAAAATGGMLCARGEANKAAALPEESWAARGISIDTRTIRPGEIFVALTDARDGHDFVRNAFKAGAAAALVSRAPKDTPNGAPLLLVEDTLKGLEALAEAARDRCFGRLIAITGSAGKTSSKEMLRAALAPSGKVHAAEKSFNNHWGVPLTLAALPSNTDFGIFEIGMNHAGEITPLSKLVRPHVAVVTTIAPAHLEFFESVAAIAEAKAEIFSGLRRAGTAILPRDNEYFDILAKRARENSGGGEGATIFSFGAAERADLRMLEYNQAGNGTFFVKAELFGKTETFCMGMAGEHQAMNALAVLGAVHASGGSLNAAIDALGKMKPVEGRGLPQRLKINQRDILLIDESYNANPASMAAAIRTLGQMNGTARKIAVLGEMRELGEASAKLHLSLAENLVAAGIDQVHAAGALMRPMLDALPKKMRGEWAENAVDLTQSIRAALETGDIIMAKGSNASRVSEFVTKLRETASVRG